MAGCLFSSVVEHQSRKLGAEGSNPTGGKVFIAYSLAFKLKTTSQLAGFEPTRAEPIGFQVQRLNHSATTAHLHLLRKIEHGDAGDRTPGLSHAKRTLYH